MAKIGVLVGSLRKESFSKKIAQAVVDLLEGKHELTFLELGDLPIYNQDFDDIGPEPDKIRAFRQTATSMDAFLFVTPEYNRSVPGGLKNALDIGSRPKVSSVWKGKPAAIITVSPSRLSAFGANHHLRQSLVFFDMPVVQQPEAYIGDAANIMNVSGVIQDESVKILLQNLAKKFDGLIKKYI